MKRDITIGDKYRPAMQITDPDEAAAYFEKCVQHTMGFDKGRAAAEEIERINLGYFAGYYDHETRLRVERLFNCAHPVFGRASEHVPTTGEALAAGLGLAQP